MPSYPAGMTVSSRALTTLADALRHHRTQRGTRWRRLDAGTQALLVVAHLRKGETYTDLATGFGIGTTTVFWRDGRPAEMWHNGDWLGWLQKAGILPSLG